MPRLRWTGGVAVRWVESWLTADRCRSLVSDRWRCGGRFRCCVRGSGAPAASPGRGGPSSAGRAGHGERCEACEVDGRGE
jgi:hypothetical protein